LSSPITIAKIGILVEIDSTAAPSVVVMSNGRGQCGLHCLEVCMVSAMLPVFRCSTFSITFRAVRTLWLLGLLLGSSVESRAATPEITVPKPSATAHRLIGDKATVFEPQSSPLPGMRLKRSLGTSDFVVGLSFDTGTDGKWDLGDLVSLWDAKTRHGFSLGLRNNTGSTTSQANWRQLQFGIDAGTEPTWREEGRPGSALLGFSIAVHDGHLYVGTCEPDAAQPGRVFRYEGAGNWKSLGSLDGANTVSAMASFGGQLYAGTGKYRLAGSALSESNNPILGGKVYRLMKNGKWEMVGDLAPTEAIAALVTYGDKLYASSMYKPAGFFRYDGDRNWTSLPTPNGKRVEALAVHDGAIYAGSYDSGSFYRYDGTKWHDLGVVARDITQTYSFVTYQRALHTATWPSGKVYRLDADNRWADAGRLGEEQEVMGMLVHNGVFYGGTLPKAEVYRYEGNKNWKLLKQLDKTPDVKFRRVWTMATYKGRLFATTLPSGKVWSMSAGSLVTDDRELSFGWHDVVAQRTSGVLRLFVDGRLAAESDASHLNMATEGLELRIGDGPRGRFTGQIRNLWFDYAP
jgi:hypothetical protein